MPKRTPSGKKTALADVEGKLKKEYPNNPGAVYGTLNKIGLMRGNKATAKGRRAAKAALLFILFFPLSMVA
jgi:hypothetical protein